MLLLSTNLIQVTPRFIGDINTYGIDEQFLWGPALLITPVLKVSTYLFKNGLNVIILTTQEETTFVTPYIPAGIWFDFYTKAALNSKGSIYNLSAPLDTIPLLIRGGYILTLQDPQLTTVELRKTPFEILAALDTNGEARGKLYWDDGDSLSR